MLRPKGQRLFLFLLTNRCSYNFMKSDNWSDGTLSRIDIIQLNTLLQQNCYTVRAHLNTHFLIFYQWKSFVELLKPAFKKWRFFQICMFNVLSEKYLRLLCPMSCHNCLIPITSSLWKHPIFQKKNIFAILPHLIKLTILLKGLKITNVPSMFLWLVNDLHTVIYVITLHLVTHYRIYE